MSVADQYRQLGEHLKQCLKHENLHISTLIIRPYNGLPCTKYINRNNRLSNIAWESSDTHNYVTYVKWY